MHKGALSWGSWKPLQDLPKPFFCLLLTCTDDVTHSLTGEHQVPSSTSFCKPRELFEVLPSTVIRSDGQERWARLPLQRWRSGQGALPVWGLCLSPEYPSNFHTIIQLWLPNTAWQWYMKKSSQVSELTLNWDNTEQEKGRHYPVYGSVVGKLEKHPSIFNFEWII